jgi:sec-independent protein translocase protein TatA
MELTIIGIIGVLCFGHRLPKVARGLGSSFMEFKRGLKSGVDEMEDTGRQLNEATRDVNREMRKD